LDDAALRERAVVIVQAPAGFGKTSLLAQWRLEHLARGAVVGWLSAQAADNEQRLLQCLVLSIRSASGRQKFGRTLLEGGARGGLSDVTEWLAEIAQTALDIVLIIDGAERLAAAAREALAYLCHNAPSNLRVIAAARSDCDLGVADLLIYGQCATLSARELRFSLEESMELIRTRLSGRLDADDSARLHELTEGWPLGLQLALTALSHDPRPGQTIAAMRASSGALHAHFLDVLLKNLPPADVEFLRRIAIVNQLHPELCQALIGRVDASDQLARLVRDTPLFLSGEGSEWVRMHSLPRDALREQFRLLLRPEQELLHARAARWFEAADMPEDAAEHALAAGEQAAAYELAERCMYESVLSRGRHMMVFEWLDRLPRAELDRRPRLMLAAAWALAVSARHAEAESWVVRILEHAGTDAALQFESALIRSGAAGFADQIDRFAELHDPWAEAPPLKDPRLLYMHANRKALRALFDGDPARARLSQQAPNGGVEDAFGYVARWREFVMGLSYLWEGQVILAEEYLRPALTAADAELGRRNPFSCMFAALLAAAVWERDRPDEAESILANRLDILERQGMPEAVLLGYRTVARIAGARGQEHRAIALLEALYAVGVDRNLPRLCIASLADQVRMHAQRNRRETCAALCERLDAILKRTDVPQGPLWRRQVELLQAMAHANAAIAAQDWRAALAPLELSGRLATAMKMGRMQIEALALRAYTLHRLGEDSASMLHEALDLARSFGLSRLFADANPALGEWAALIVAEHEAADTALAPKDAPASVNARSAPRAMPSMALTPKEREVLELLARNLSNKEVARAMQVGEETVKWHVKNLFVKLSADTRKQVVRRAQLLGLLEETP
jgi:LuxR family transcriptional regulator, maltose regulon positive regulatory protein